MSRQDSLYIPKQKTARFSHGAVTVSWKQDDSRLARLLNEAQLAAYHRLFAIAMDCPKKALKPLRSLIEEVGPLPELLNLLSYCYVAKKRPKKADKMIYKNYFTNPDNLIARINYADFCLRKKRVSEVADIFDKKYTLPELYPDRKVYHVSEFRGFMVVMGLFHLAENQQEKAICYHYLAHKVDPNHPGTKHLQKILVN